MLMQIPSRSMVIMISTVISLSHHPLFGYWNVLWNASVHLENLAKLQLMPQSFSLMFPLQHYADGVELQQLNQSQS